LTLFGGTRVDRQGLGSVTRIKTPKTIVDLTQMVTCQSGTSIHKLRGPARDLEIEGNIFHAIVYPALRRKHHIVEKGSMMREL
jgi:hypothetical protein